MPLEFLKRKGRAEVELAPAPVVPEDASAQEYILKLYYAGKSTEGVRLKAGPRALAELPSMLVGLAQTRDRGRRAPADRVQRGGSHDHPVLGGDAVGQRPPRPRTDHPSRALRPRVDRRDRPGVRHARGRAARRGGGHVRLSRVQRRRGRGRLALGRGHRRHAGARRRGLGWPGRPRRHRPDRAREPSPGSSRTSSPTSTRSGSRLPIGRFPPPAGAGWSARTAASASAHERAFYCPKCGMRLLRG